MKSSPKARLARRQIAPNTRPVIDLAADEAAERPATASSRISASAL